MASKGTTPRSVADATRFTANTPHANTKSTPSGPGAAASSKAATLPRRVGSAATSAAMAGAGAIPRETMEERVRRLRAAHLAAKQHNVSKLDQVIANSRRFFDAAHKYTVMGFVGFSGLALLVTVYATVDMAMHNRQRRSEFLAMRKQLHEDSLEAARLAYMTGTATEEQAALVEEATEKANQTGVSLPPLLSAPRPAAPPRRREGESSSSTLSSERTVWPGESMTETNMSSDSASSSSNKGGITGWLFGGLKKSETTSDDDDGISQRAATSEVVGGLRDKAKAAFEHERDNQRRGGPLDHVGLAAAAEPSSSSTSNNSNNNPEGGSKKKGWLW
ncbi:hypothetical protein F5Y17DRAFT_42745 [Xylariaceae sp. FL0594]|nr:hypothetical protein F5Y17DRAFT_42745 [Xylariaceae sp. FL0594]